MNESTCSIDGCNKGGRTVKGMCMMHYERMRRTGSTDAPHLAKAEARFWSNVDKSGSCWIWTSSRNKYGYGRFSVGRENQMLAHRYAWEILYGPIPSKIQLDHICHNHACVNPGHLRETTNKQNHEHLKGAFANSKSGVRGVSWDASKMKWRATVGHNYKQYHVGRYDSMEEAEAAVIAKRLELFTHNDLDRAA